MRIAAMQEWLMDPHLLEADPDAQYSEILDIDLSAINEPLLACPNDLILLNRYHKRKELKLTKYLSVVYDRDRTAGKSSLDT